MTPTSVDLRANINEVYDQSTTAACFPHAVVNALDAMYDHAGQSQRFSRSHLWYWGRFHMGLVGRNVGVSPNAMQKAISENGIALAQDAPWEQTGGFSPSAMPGFKLVRTALQDSYEASIKRLLLAGIPVVWLMQTTPMFGAMAFYKNWRTSPPIPADNSQPMGQHAVCIVGYDDECQRFLVENSYGKAWGDGGFFGMPYTSLRSVTEDVLHIDIAPIHPKPAEGYTMTTPTMTMIGKSEFTDRASSALKAHLISAFAAGPLNLMAECIKWGVSDKHLESLFDWPRGTVRSFKIDNPTLPWDGFVLEQM